jgi:hypothetical protein
MVRERYLIEQPAAPVSHMEEMRHTGARLCQAGIFIQNPQLENLPTLVDLAAPLPEKYLPEHMSRFWGGLIASVNPATGARQDQPDTATGERQPPLCFCPYTQTSKLLRCAIGHGEWTGPSVRTDSLLERRGFELPVSFVF